MNLHELRTRHWVHSLNGNPSTSWLSGASRNLSLTAECPELERIPMTIVALARLTGQTKASPSDNRGECQKLYSTRGRRQNMPCRHTLSSPHRRLLWPCMRWAPTGGSACPGRAPRPRPPGPWVVVGQPQEGRCHGLGLTVRRGCGVHLRMPACKVKNKIARTPTGMWANAPASMGPLAVLAWETDSGLASGTVHK